MDDKTDWSMLVILVVGTLILTLILGVCRTLLSSIYFFITLPLGPIKCIINNIRRTGSILSGLWYKFAGRKPSADVVHLTLNTNMMRRTGEGTGGIKVDGMINYIRFIISRCLMITGTILVLLGGTELFSEAVKFFAR